MAGRRGPQTIILLSQGEPCFDILPVFVFLLGYYHGIYNELQQANSARGKSHYEQGNETSLQR